MPNDRSGRPAALGADVRHPGMFVLCRAVGGCVAALALAGCTAAARDSVRQLNAPSRAAAVTTAGPDASMIYVARVQGGVVVIDLGWVGADAALRRTLRQLGATPDDVVAVFLTHSHRDHLGAWRAVRRAPFYVGAAEVGVLAGRARYRGWIPRLAERVYPTRGPCCDSVEVRPLGRDTTVTLGADTVRAFRVPGHTAGSEAYLFRGVLFGGDAVSHTMSGALRSARAGYSDDVRGARESLRQLWIALEPYDVRMVCTAHARCAPYTPALRQALSRPGGDSPRR